MVATAAKYISRLYRKQDILKEHCPEYMICEQEFLVEPFALNPEFDVVISKQQRQYGIFINRESGSNIRDFYRYSMQMQDSKFTLPDIVGRDNVIIPDGQSHPVIIDTIPIEKSDPADFAAYHAAKSILGI